MTWRHPTEEQLKRFSLGTLEEAEAVAVALHIDECPQCAAIASAADPLTHAFNEIDDPIVPLDLIDEILDIAEEPVSLGPEPAIAAGFSGGQASCWSSLAIRPS